MLKKLIVSLPILLLLGIGAFAGVNIDSVIANPPLLPAYPDDESIIIYEGINYTMMPDGRISKKVHTVRALYNESGMDDYGEVFIGYYDDKQVLNIEKCCVYMIDGKRVDSHENAFNLTTPFTLDRAPDYTGFQEMVVTFTGLEWKENSDKGSISEIIYTITDKEPISNWMEGIEYFQTDEYIINKEVTVTLLENMMLNYSFLNGDGNVKQSVKEGMKTWTWSVRNREHTLHDDAYRFRMRYAPTLVFSTCESWKVAGKLFGGKTLDMMKDSDYIKKEAKDVLGDCMVDYNKVLKLSKMVRERVRTISYDEGMLKLFPRSAEKTLKSAYGTTYNKAILLTALLRSQGIKAGLALSAEAYESSFSVPMLGYFDSFRVVAEIDGEEVYIDPLHTLADNSRRDLAGDAVFKLDFSGNSPFIEPSYKFEQNKVIMNLNVKIADDGSYSGHGFFSAGGYFSPYYEITEDSDGVTGWLKSNFESVIPNLEVTSGSSRKLSENKCEMTFEFKGDKLGEIEEGYLVAPVTHSPVSVDALAPSGFHSYYTEHKNPIFMKGSGSMSINAVYNLPDKWKVASVPINVEKSDDISSTKIIFTGSDGKLEVNASFAVKVDKIESKQYNAFRDFYSRKTNNNSHIVFKID